MPARYEELLALIGSHLAAPVTREQAPDGSLYFVGGDPQDVIVRVSSATVIVSEYAVRWEGPTTAVVRPIRVGSVAWRRIPETSAMRIVSALIDAARQSRLDTFRPCASCETPTPPEWMHDGELCRSCAARERSSPAGGFQSS